MSSPVCLWLASALASPASPVTPPPIDDVRTPACILDLPIRLLVFAVLQLQPEDAAVICQHLGQHTDARVCECIAELTKHEQARSHFTETPFFAFVRAALADSAGSCAKSGGHAPLPRFSPLV